MHKVFNKVLSNIVFLHSLLWYISCLTHHSTLEGSWKVLSSTVCCRLFWQRKNFLHRRLWCLLLPVWQGWPCYRLWFKGSYREWISCRFLESCKRSLDKQNKIRQHWTHHSWCQFLHIYHSPTQTSWFLSEEDMWTHTDLDCWQCTLKCMSHTDLKEKHTSHSSRYRLKRRHLQCSCTQKEHSWQ